MRRKNAFLTPSTIPDGAICRPVFIPDHPEWLAIVSGALAVLTKPYSWEQSGAVTPQEAAERMTQMLVEYYEGSCGGVTEETVPTPYWDEEQDLDDEQPADLQTWYGYVTDWTAPIDGLTFVENAAVWAITGFVAYATGVGAAVTFRTVARNFVLAVQRENVGEAIRVIVNGVQETKIDTTPYAVGEVVEVPIAVETEAEFYDIIIVGSGQS